MALNSLSFLESIDSIGPSSAGFSADVARAVMPMQLLNPTTNDLQDSITTILGTTFVDKTDGRLQRQLPLAHPTFPWLFASSIESIRGMGAPTKELASSALEAPPFPFYALYPQYEFTVTFTPRNYPVLKDASVDLTGGQTWYNFDGTSNTNKVYASEWNRFAWYELSPRPDNITAQFGQMLFRTQSGSAPGNGVQFAGQPRIFINTQALTIHWVGVPFRYIDSSNSWIRSKIGTINQYDFWKWNQGELLYINYDYRLYTPPVPQLETINGVVTTQKLCDITFHFLQTTRTGNDVPATPLANRNFIPAGHNLLPWLQNRTGFYYASTDNASAASQYPTYMSFPHQLLFTDPDL